MDEKIINAVGNVFEEACNKLECYAMAIVNFINETNNVDVETRQRNNDVCFDYVRNKLMEFYSEE
jgi:hypothetical protein